MYQVKFLVNGNLPFVEKNINVLPRKGELYELDGVLHDVTSVAHRAFDCIIAISAVDEARQRAWEAYTLGMAKR